MYNILIVDDEDTLLEAFEDYLSDFSDRLEVSLASNGNEAVNVLENKPVDLVVTDLMMPEMDGFELLTYLNNNFPSIPIIVMSGYGNAETKNRLKSQDSLVFLDKPVRLKDLEEAIFAGLEDGPGKGSITGVSLASFVQLINSEQKTCLLEAKTEGKKPGYLYFNRGEPWDAVWDDYKGKEAAVEIIGWERAEINFKSLPKKKIRKRIDAEIMSLIMEAVSNSDEKSHEKKVRSEDTGDAGKDFNFEDALDFSENAGEPPSLLAEELRQFLDIPGVEAVMVIDNDGTVFESTAATGAYEMEKIGASLSMVLGGVERMGKELEIAHVQSLTLESADAMIVGAPVGKRLLVIVARDSQRLGMIRNRIKKKTPDLEEQFKNA